LDGVELVPLLVQGLCFQETKWPGVWTRRAVQLGALTEDAGLILWFIDGAWNNLEGDILFYTVVEYLVQGL
jgi:hypothetical protein